MITFNILQHFRDTVMAKFAQVYLKKTGQWSHSVIWAEGMSWFPFSRHTNFSKQLKPSLSFCGMNCQRQKLQESLPPFKAFLKILHLQEHHPSLFGKLNVKLY